MSDEMEAYYRDELNTFEEELYGFDSYVKFKNVDEYKEYGFYGLDEFSPLEIKFAKIYLKKRILWLQKKIASINNVNVKDLFELN